jgi:hypothetical protein
MSHHVQCRCGKVQGELATDVPGNRVNCFCQNCRAFGRFTESLGGKPVLGAQGGSEILQVPQSALTLTTGGEHLAAIRLNEQGMTRWYASCCGTAIGNTLNDGKLPFVGLIHSCLDESKLAQDFGSRVGQANVESALGEPKPAARGTLKMLWSFLKITLRAKFGPKNSPFFKDGAPVAPPRVLTSDEYQSLLD